MYDLPFDKVKKLMKKILEFNFDNHIFLLSNTVSYYECGFRATFAKDNGIRCKH